MARKKTIASIEAEMEKVKNELKKTIWVCQINCVSRADYSTHLFFE